MLPNPYHRVHDWLWAREPKSPAERHALHASRYALALARDLLEGEISLRAMSLVYTTLLSLVPFLALSFSVLKALGAHNFLEPVLQRLLEPLGDQAAVIAHSILGFVDNIKVGVLGSIGVGMLLYTAVSMIAKIEASFNYIWKIGTTRRVVQRFGEYLSVLIVGPVLVFSAIGLTASVRSSAIVGRLATIEPFGTTILVVTEMAPYALIVAAFSFLYAFLPNTRVRMVPALAGGLFAGVAWQSASVGFATFVTGASNYSAIYSGFAIVIILLIWLYLGWLIILFGCRLAFYLQNPRYLSGELEEAPASAREAEFLALTLMALVVSRFLDGEPPLPYDELRRRLTVSGPRFELTVAALVQQGVLAETAPDRRLLPARDPATYTLADLWRWGRGPDPVVNGREAADHRALGFLRTIEAEADARGAIPFSEWLRGADAD
jgi:membrane protein